MRFFKTKNMFKMMKCFGFSPIYMEQDKRNYILPILMCLVHIFLILGRILCMTTDHAYFDGYGSISNLCTYLETFFLLAFSIFIFKKSVSEIKSWKIVFEIAELYSRNERTMCYKTVFIIIHISYAIITASELTHPKNRTFECYANWFYNHVSRYFTNMVIYFV